MPNPSEDVIIAIKCFCGRYVYTDTEDKITCGTKECNILASKFGSVSNWLITNVENLEKIDEQEIVLNKLETKIVLYMKSVKISVTQKTIATETGLAKSTVSRTLKSLIKKKLVLRNEWGTDFREKGKNIVYYSLE